MTIDIASLVLGFVGVAVGIYGIWDSRQQRQKIELVISRIEGYAAGLINSPDKFERPIGNTISQMLADLERKYE